MLSIRQVYGSFRSANNIPIANEKIVFELSGVGVQGIDQVIPSRIEVFLDENGDFSNTELWTNELSPNNLIYWCYLPNNQKFSFSLPYGDDPISLAELQALGTPLEDSQSLIGYINQYIDANITETDSNRLIYISSVAVSALRVVAVSVSGLVYADPINPWSIVGISLNAALVGENCTIAISGKISDISWAWDTAKPIFLGDNGDGVMTQTAPTSGAVIQIARPLSASEIMIDIEILGIF